MHCTLSLDGHAIGTTDLEAMPVAGHHAGVLHPTPRGLEVLPSITAMVPALFDFRTMWEERAIDTTGEDDDVSVEAYEAFAHTLEGIRIQNAARRIARLELRDPAGEILPWRTILVTDMNDLRALAGARSGDAPEPDAAESPERVPIRYLVSVTFARTRRSGRQRGAPSVC